MTIQLPVVLDRQTPFSYECGSCRSCCIDNVVHVSPYDIARIAKNRHLTTTEVIGDFTTDEGTTLGVRSDGACIFLDERGCAIHADRPMICRLYPLGRSADEAGRETYVALEPHPETLGRYGELGRVADYLERQGVEPYIAAADRYYEVLLRMRDLIGRRSEASADRNGGRVSPAEGSRSLDMDPAVARYCEAHGLDVPEQVDEKLELHLRALNEWLDGLESSTSAGIGA